MEKETKRVILISLLSICMFLNQSCRGQNIYYISSNGNDNNDGLSDARPLKTLKTVRPGNTYLFNRRDTFYFAINKADNPSNKKIVIGAYGKGKKPVFSLYKKIKNEFWESSGNNIWRIDLKNQTSYTGFMDNTSTNVGFIKVGTEIKGNKLSSIDLLKVNWDFYSDDKYLYVYNDSDLGKVSNDVQIATKVFIITLSNHMYISEIALKGTGGHGISGVLCKDDTIKNVDISEIGGSYLNKSLRFGNGIEFWQGASNCLVYGCNVEQVYDVAYTIQGNQPQSSFENIVFSNNKANNNEQSFEFWVKSPDGSFKNCSFINNNCANAGFGWSYDVQPNKRLGVHLLSPIWTDGMAGLTIENNSFVNARSGYSYLSKELISGKSFKSFNNKISLKSSVPLRADNSYGYKIKDKINFVKSSGLENGSTFKQN